MVGLGQEYFIVGGLGWVTKIGSMSMSGIYITCMSCSVYQQKQKQKDMRSEAKA